MSQYLLDGRYRYALVTQQGSTRMSRRVERYFSRDAALLLQFSQVTVDVAVVAYVSKTLDRWILAQYLQSLSSEYQVQWNLDMAARLLGLYRQPHPSFQFMEIQFVQLLEIGKSKSGVAAEEEGIPYVV